MNLKMLFIISDNEEKLNDLLKRYTLPFNTTFSGIGTASKSMLDYFGLVPTEKKIMMSIIPDYSEREIITDLKKNLKIQKRGKGIAFTISISSSSKYVRDSFIREEEEKKMKNARENQLIITVVNSGYSDLVMHAAKSAGANGGTLIKGRALGEKNSFKLFNMTIEPERDIILIVCQNDERKKIMESILKKEGIKKEGKGICISLPIDNVIGLDNV